jgi:chromosome partitioning protein
MIITCGQCRTRYSLDEELTRNRPVVKVRCSKCGNKFEVEPAAAAEAPSVPEWDRTICISNQKGGVAKTSTCMNLGLSLSMMRKRVLLIDFDVQANLTLSLGYPSDTPSFFDILQSGRSASEFIENTGYEGLSLLPSNSRMALLPRYYMHRDNFEFLLRDKLAGLAGQYDYIIIDTPPALDFCTLNALMASHHVIIPTPCEYLSLHGISRIEDIIRIIRERTGREIDYRILVTMHDEQSTASRVIFQKIVKMYRDRVLQTVIENDQRLKESQIVHLPVYKYDRESLSARQYEQLAREIATLIA